MGGLRLSFEEELLCATYPVALAIVGFSGELGLLIGGNGKPWWHMDGWVKEASVDRRTPDGDEVADATSEDVGNAPKSSIACNHDVERTVVQDLPQSVFVEYVAVQVNKPCHLGNLVISGVQNRHLVPARFEAQRH
jgi:hypothetical protein